MKIVHWIILGILVVAAGVLLADYFKRMKAEKAQAAAFAAAAAAAPAPVVIVEEAS